MTLHNDGTGYEIRDDEGIVVGRYVEYLDAIAHIRRCQPELPAHLGFAPEPESIPNPT